MNKQESYFAQNCLGSKPPEPSPLEVAINNLRQPGTITLPITEYEQTLKDAERYRWVRDHGDATFRKLVRLLSNTAQSHDVDIWIDNRIRSLATKGAIND